jgi:hypothetical protein
LKGVLKVATGAAVVLAAAVGLIFVLEEYNPGKLRGNEIRSAFDAGDGERLLELAARRNWPEEQRRFAIGRFTDLARANPEQRDDYEQRLAELRDAPASDDDLSNYLWALTNLNSEMVRAFADDLAVRVDPFVGSTPPEGATFEGPQSVDLLLNLTYPLFPESAAEAGRRYEPTWNRGNEPEPGLVGLDGLTRAEIDARLSDLDRIGVVIHRSRIIGHYEGCQPDVAVAHYARTEAVQNYAVLHVIDLDEDRVVAAAVVEGEEPARSIGIRSGSNNCSSEGPRPDLDGYFTVGFR